MVKSLKRLILVFVCTALCLIALRYLTQNVLSGCVDYHRILVMLMIRLTELLHQLSIFLVYINLCKFFGPE